MKYLVTGSAGFIGQNLMARLDDAAGLDIADGGNVISIGPRDFESFDTVIHLAALSGIADCNLSSHSAYLNNVTGIWKVLQAARACECRVVFASSQGASTDHIYGASKLAGEAFCKAFRNVYGVETVILRLGNVYGPRSMHKNSCVAQMCKDALTKGVITVHGSGLQIRAFVHIDDVCTALLEVKKDSYIGAIKTSVLKVAEKIAEFSGASIEHKGSGRGHELPKTDRDWPIWSKQSISLSHGLKLTWEWFYENRHRLVDSSEHAASIR